MARFPVPTGSVILLVAVICLQLSPVWGASASPFNHTLAGTDWAIIPGLNASLCGSGQSQSPTNIVPANATSSSNLTAVQIAYATNLTNINVTNLGDVVELVISSGSNIITLPTNIYQPTNGSALALQQFHFHTPSEHMVNGMFHAAEMHFVHKDPASGQSAVLAVFLDLDQADADNPTLAYFLPNVSDKYNVTVQEPSNVTLDLYNLFPSNASYWYYNGSLTTPPCSQNVLWVVYTTPLTFSTAQLLTFELANAGGDGSRADNRIVQPLNTRTVALYQG